VTQRGVLLRRPAARISVEALNQAHVDVLGALGDAADQLAWPGDHARCAFAALAYADESDPLGFVKRHLQVIEALLDVLRDVELNGDERWQVVAERHVDVAASDFDALLGESADPDDLFGVLLKEAAARTGALYEPIQQLLKPARTHYEGHHLRAFGRIMARTDGPDAAAWCAREALMRLTEAFQDGCNQRFLALVDLSSYLEEAADLPGAVTALEDGLEICFEDGHLINAQAVLQRLSALEEERGDAPRAIAYIAYSLVISKWTGRDPADGRKWMSLGSLAAATGSQDAAEHCVALGVVIAGMESLDLGELADEWQIGRVPTPRMEALLNWARQTWEAGETATYLREVSGIGEPETEAFMATFATNRPD
jgi:hypothetical protein